MENKEIYDKSLYLDLEKARIDDDLLPINQNIKDKINYFLDSNKIPHIIFHGSSGTGKRTIVYDFINKIYGNDRIKIKQNVMYVNCSHGKGIKFIREELKFFAKSNIQSNSGVNFKSIILMNADFLTIDAQSALRRCIELFSFNTRFFIIVENKHKLLNPILSRFCEIYVPDYIVDRKVLNLHQYNLDKHVDLKEYNKEKMDLIVSKMPKSNKIVNIHCFLVDLAEEFYENGISCLDLMHFIETCGYWSFDLVSEFQIKFYSIKSEYRCEKLLMLYIFNMLYGKNEKL